MIDANRETVVTFSQACKLIPQRRRNKRPSLPTIYRWANDGIQGVKLEWLRIGGTRCTSKEAMQRFFEALTVAAEAKTAAHRGIDPAVTKAEGVLSAAGI